MDLEIRALRSRLNLDGEKSGPAPPRDAYRLADMSLAFQPIIDLDGLGLVGIEALARWRDPSDRTLTASEFLPALSTSPLRQSFMSWVLGQACNAIRRWTELGLEPPPLTVNASTVETSELPLSRLTQTALRDGNVPPGALQLEFPSGVLAGRGLGLLHELQALLALGVSVSVDLSDLDPESLERAASIGVFDVKIDLQSIASPRHREQAARVTEQARSLGLIVTAKRAETLEDLALLNSLGCQRAQGYSFGAPMSADDIEQLLGEHSGSHRANPRVTRLAAIERVVHVPASGDATQLLGAMLVDLNEGGMELRLANNLEVGDELRLHLTLPASIEPVEVRLHTVAVRDLHGTYGVQGRYLELPPALRESIAREVGRHGRSAAA